MATLPAAGEVPGAGDNGSQRDHDGIRAAEAQAGPRVARGGRAVGVGVARGRGDVGVAEQLLDGRQRQALGYERGERVAQLVERHGLDAGALAPRVEETRGLADREGGPVR